MAGLWSRTMLIIKSKYSNLLNRSENPTETLDYSYEQMLQQLQNVKRGVADVVTAKKRLEIQTQGLEQNVVKLETQARQAVAANREDLARQALERKASAQQQLQGLDAQVQQLAQQQDKLIDSQHQLEARIEAFRTQKEVIKAQYSAAEAQVKIGEAATGIGKGMEDTGLAIQRAKDKTDELQARASAIDELTSAGSARGPDAAGLDAARPRAGADLLVGAGRRRAGEAEGGGRHGRRREAARRRRRTRRGARTCGRPARGAAGGQARVVAVPFTDIFFGRKKLKEPAGDRLFALTTAAVTLDVECGLKPAGVGAVVFKPLSAGEFSQVDQDVEQLLQAVAAGSGSKLDRKTDSFGFEWVIVQDPDLEDQVTAVHAVADEFQARGFGAQLLGAAFRFGDASHPTYWIYGFKTGTFWPFVPTGQKQERDNARELELKAKLEPELPIEPDLSKWLGLFDAPI